jgi:hypothetical protein
MNISQDMNSTNGLPDDLETGGYVASGGWLVGGEVNGLEKS